MNLKNCKRCGKVYQSSNPEICPDCMEMERDDFAKVRNFIKENPKVSIDVVIEATGVDEEKIREYLKMGRIEAAELTGRILECERCGKPIYSGEYCVMCQSEISRTFRSGLKGTTVDQPAKKKPGSFIRKYRQERD